MKIEFIVNGGVSAILCPESEMETLILQNLVKQQNTLIEVRGAVNVLSKTIRGSVLICKKDSFILPQEEEQSKDKNKEK